MLPVTSVACLLHDEHTLLSLILLNTRAARQHVTAINVLHGDMHGDLTFT